ncbi:uncharacterized protein LOC144030717 isoform X2 [Festucalex cinctus]
MTSQLSRTQVTTNQGSACERHMTKFRKQALGYSQCSPNTRTRAASESPWQQLLSRPNCGESTSPPLALTHSLSLSPKRPKLDLSQCFSGIPLNHHVCVERAEEEEREVSGGVNQKDTDCGATNDYPPPTLLPFLEYKTVVGGDEDAGDISGPGRRTYLSGRKCTPQETAERLSRRYLGEPTSYPGGGLRRLHNFPCTSATSSVFMWSLSVSEFPKQGEHLKGERSAGIQ